MRRRRRRGAEKNPQGFYNPTASCDCETLNLTRCIKGVGERERERQKERGRGRWGRGEGRGETDKGACL